MDPEHDVELHDAFSAEMSRKYNKGSDWVQFLPLQSVWEKEKFKDLTHAGAWTISSCKIDGSVRNGVYELQSESSDDYWQSEGVLPHWITLELPKKTDISFIFFYADHTIDESYTPEKCVVRLGSSLMHIDREISYTFKKPLGWEVIDLRQNGKAVRAFFLQFAVNSNHHGGRDTRIRQFRVVGPAKEGFPNTVTSFLKTPTEDNRKEPVRFMETYPIR